MEREEREEIKELKDLKLFLDKLNAEKLDLKKKRAYMFEHNFNKEAEYLETKIKVIEEISYGLEDVVSGNGCKGRFQF